MSAGWTSAEVQTPREQQRPSSALGPVVAVGRTADVHAWRSGWVLKLFHDRYDRAEVERVARVSRAVEPTGLPVPAVGDVVVVDGRLGLEFESAAGPTWLEQLWARPWRLVGLARRSAALHARVHAQRGGVALPGLRQRLAERIERADALSGAARARLLADLAALPDGDRLCHGDFHPGNVVAARDGAVIIDWVDAARGHPSADVARTSVLLSGFADCEAGSAWQRAAIRAFHAAYRNAYLTSRPGEWDTYRRWLPIVAVARLSDGITEQESWLVARAERRA